ncbi:thiolase family protein [Rhodococcus pyridinivorans]|uniref:thiolase family protein n=1 Tax=Rhodococcus TaxID=1827 RepID=UPI000B5A3E73|nr:thiolase family protein [Rhodococcus sp. BUPNP1]OWY78986.1 DitF protein [Rhodococcus sp. BUPNP1]
MSAANTAVLIGAAEEPYTRHPAGATTTQSMLAAAIRSAVADAGLTIADIDGLAVSSFTLKPDHTVDLAMKCGLSLRWIMEDTNGGASGINMLQHAVRAVEAGDANTIVIAAGDRMTHDDFRTLVSEYNGITRDHVTPAGMSGPNAMFALLTQRHMKKYELAETDYGAIAVAQRQWASLNPRAVYRTPMTLDDYLAAPMVAAPLRRFDCVPPVSGADAVVVTRADLAADRHTVRVRAIGGSINWDNHTGDGLQTGLTDIAPGLWERSGVDPTDIDLVNVYDDYPVMVLIQLADLGLVPDDDFGKAVHRMLHHRWPVNTSGGQLSAGQAGSAGGLHGLVEATTQLLGHAGKRQVEARLAAVTGYGMVTYRYGACANMTILEAM